MLPRVKLVNMLEASGDIVDQTKNTMSVAHEKSRLNEKILLDDFQEKSGSHALISGLCGFLDIA
jgi:hypothetical protein